MAGFKIKINKSALKTSFRQTLNNLLDDPKLQKEVGVFAVDRIRAFARKTKPLNKTRSFPKLQPSTVANRGRLAKLNRTQRTYAQPRSNLTLTGQLLDGLKFKITKKRIINVFTSGKRKMYRTSKNSFAKPNSVNSKNETLASVLSDKGFKIMGSFDKAGEKRIRNIYLKFLRRKLRKQ